MIAEGGPDPVELPHPEVAVMPADAKADLDLARLIGRTVTHAALSLGLPHEGVPFEELCQNIIATAASNPGRCPLDSASFKAVYETRAVLTPRAAAGA